MKSETFDNVLSFFQSLSCSIFRRVLYKGNPKQYSTEIIKTLDQHKLDKKL